MFTWGSDKLKQVKSPWLGSRSGGWSDGALPANTLNVLRELDMVRAILMRES